MDRFGHENGPFWMLAGAVLVLFFLPLGPFWSEPFWFAWAVFDLHWGRFGDGPFWSVPYASELCKGPGSSVWDLCKLPDSGGNQGEIPVSGLSGKSGSTCVVDGPNTWEASDGHGPGDARVGWRIITEGLVA